MSQEYKLVQFKPSDFKDQHNNTWCDIALEGISEPVKWVVKDPSRIVVGKSYYGRIEDKTSKADRPYRRFYAETKPDKEEPRQDEAYWEDRNSKIKAQWAIGQAVQIAIAAGTPEAYKNIETEAKSLFGMVERVAKGETSEDERREIEKDFHPIFDPNEPINLDDIPF